MAAVLAAMFWLKNDRKLPIKSEGRGVAISILQLDLLSSI
jgi:hypothetical protein